MLGKAPLLAAWVICISWFFWRRQSLPTAWTINRCLRMNWGPVVGCLWILKWKWFLHFGWGIYIKRVLGCLYVSSSSLTRHLLKWSHFIWQFHSMRCSECVQVCPDERSRACQLLISHTLNCFAAHDWSSKIPVFEFCHLLVYLSHHTLAIQLCQNLQPLEASSPSQQPLPALAPPSLARCTVSLPYSHASPGPQKSSHSYLLTWSP